MRLAIREAARNLKDMYGGPFGACIELDGKAIAVARNTVIRDDATCHAEVNCIRLASRLLRRFDLSGCVLYSTTEPCPMCFGAIHWARIGRVVYGSAIKDAARAGFNELGVSNAELKRLGKSRIGLYRAFLRKDCNRLFKRWCMLEERVSY